VLGGQSEITERGFDVGEHAPEFVDLSRALGLSADGPRDLG
jgi:hypothetical protein